METGECTTKLIVFYRLIMQPVMAHPRLE